MPADYISNAENERVRGRSKTYIKEYQERKKKGYTHFMGKDVDDMAHAMAKDTLHYYTRNRPQYQKKSLKKGK